MRIYARVSSEKQAEAGNLERQKARLMAATAKRDEVAVVVAPRASGLNEKRLACGACSDRRRLAKLTGCWSSSKSD